MAAAKMGTTKIFCIVTPFLLPVLCSLRSGIIILGVDGIFMRNRIFSGGGTGSIVIAGSQEEYAGNEEHKRQFLFHNNVLGGEGAVLMNRI